MSATNLTKNLKLSQFVASDKPSWLGDVNGDNKKIDDGYGVLVGEISKANDTASSAKSQSDANTQTLTNVNSELEDYGNRITALEAGGGTEQLEQRVNTLGSDVEALQTRADTFEENITQNGNNITSLTERMTAVEGKAKTNENNITSLQSVTSELTETVQENSGKVQSLTTSVETQGRRLKSTETTASNAFNKSQENSVAISTLNNEVSNKTSVQVTSIALITESSVNNSINGSQMMIVAYDGINLTYFLQISLNTLTLSTVPSKIGTVDLSGIIPDIANKTLLFNQSTYTNNVRTLFTLNGEKDINNQLSLTLAIPAGSASVTEQNLIFVGSIIVINN